MDGTYDRTKPELLRLRPAGWPGSALVADMTPLAMITALANKAGNNLIEGASQAAKRNDWDTYNLYMNEHLFLLRELERRYE
ncbi:MAG TPA: hypothetical protein ENK38_01980 [Gammaproteobacteria bacterium]|nr:hypothetical protein [Gammaproteobacteria bacterium]